MKIPCKVNSHFNGSTITIVLAETVTLKGTKEDGHYAFIFNDKAENYYIFATLQQGVINNNLPNYLEVSFKELLIESVNQYCESARQGLPDSIFSAYLKKNSLCSQITQNK